LVKNERGSTAIVQQYMSPLQSISRITICNSHVSAKDLQKATVIHLIFFTPTCNRTYTSFVIAAFLGLNAEVLEPANDAPSGLFLRPTY